jgi:hypothetical protein
MQLNRAGFDARGQNNSEVRVAAVTSHYIAWAAAIVTWNVACVNRFIQ